jgi:hypothetical protein
VNRRKNKLTENKQTNNKQSNKQIQQLSKQIAKTELPVAFAQLILYDK